MKEKHQKAIWLTAVGVFLLFSGLVGWFIGRPMVELAREPEIFREWVDGHGLWGRLIFVGMVFLQVLVAMIPGEPLELMGGYAFGAAEGTMLTMVGIVLGSGAVFLLVRKFGVRMVEIFFPKKQIHQMEFLKNPRKAKAAAFVLMLIPGTPKDFLSYFAGLTPLTLSQWLGIVVIARIPSVVTSTVSGGAAGARNYLLAGIMLTVTLLLSGAGIWYYRRLCQSQQLGYEKKNLPKAG